MSALCEQAYIFTPPPDSDEPIPEKIDFNSNEPKDVETCWKSVKLVGILSFLSMIEGGLIMAGEWPYMSEVRVEKNRLLFQIDPLATANFFGLASSASKVGKITFSLIFSFWTYKTKTVRPPLVVGRIIALIGCILYLCVEFLSSGRRYLMLICYIFFAIASSSATVLRVYVVAISSGVDRPKAFALIALATTMSIVAGPALQLAFSWIKYPGYTLFSNVHFNLYTAPIWVSTFLNVVSISITVNFLEEKLIITKHVEDETSPPLSLTLIKDTITKLKKEDVPWILVALCCLEKMVVGLTMSTLASISAPLNMAVFSWDGQTQVLVTSISMLICGVLSIGTTSVIMGTSITKKVPMRIMFLFAVSIMAFMYLGTYPLPGISSPVPVYNATTGKGCNPSTYSWCTTASATKPLIFIAVTLAVMGFSMPMVHISVDTVYSKILAKIDQSIMQGFAVILEDLVMIFGPLYATEMFTFYGQAPLWIANGVATVTAALLWFVSQNSLKKYQ